MQKVMIPPATYENVRQAVGRAFELFPLDLAGKKVLIKPNVLRASEAREGIVTHPKAKLHQVAGSPERFHELVVEVFRSCFCCQEICPEKAMALRVQN